MGSGWAADHRRTLSSYNDDRTSLTGSMGRPKDHRIWGHYRILPDRSVSCKFCEKVYKFSNVVKMLQHLITCRKSPEIVKILMKTIRDESSKTKGHVLKRNDIKMCMKTIPDDSSKTKGHVLKITDTRRSASSSANSDTHFEDFDEIDPTTTLFAKAIFVSGTPLSIVEHPLWIQVFEKIQPNFRMPSRKALSTKYLEKIYKEMHLELDEESNACDYLHLQCDGWSNLRNEGIINFLISKPQPTYIKSLNTETNAHTSEHLSQEIEEIMRVYGEHKFHVLIGDNAENVQEAFELIKVKYPHVVTLGCSAHLLNLLCQDCLKVQDIQCFIMEALNLIETIKRRQRLNSLLTKLSQNQNSARILKLPCVTRWENPVISLKSLKSNKIALQMIVNEDVLITREIINDDFWRKTDECISILEPITESIFNLEGDRYGIHKVYLTFKDILAKISSALPNISMLNEEGKQQILTSIAERCKMFTKPIHLAAYMLDPAAQGVELTQEEELQAMECIHDLGEQLSLHNVIVELACYKAKENFWARQFIWSSVSSIEPIVWWKGICRSTELSKVAVRILSAPCTSASTERSFSIQGHIHNTSNRLSTEIAEKISYVFYNWNLKHNNENNQSDEENEDENIIGTFIDQFNKSYQLKEENENRIESFNMDQNEPTPSTSDEARQPLHFVSCINDNVESDSD